MKSIRKVTIEEIKDHLSKKKIKFYFKKLNGELRIARGTTNLKHIPFEKHPKGVKESSNKVVVFFDLEKREWISFSINTEVWIC